MQERLSGLALSYERRNMNIDTEQINDKFSNIK